MEGGGDEALLQGQGLKEGGRGEAAKEGRKVWGEGDDDERQCSQQAPP